MSQYWVVIAPVGIAALVLVVWLAERLSRRPGAHADRARLHVIPAVQEETVPVAAATVPVAAVAGAPPWDSGLTDGQDDPLMREKLLRVSEGLREKYGGDQPEWAAPEADRYTGYGWASGSSGYGLSPEQEATLRHELHHVDDLDLGPGAGFDSAGYNSHLPSPGKRMKVDRPAPAGLPREDGAGDESEASGPPAPPAPPMRLYWSPPLEAKIEPPRDPLGTHPPHLVTATDLALARCDAFMVAMRADHARWLSGARERWAA